MVSTKGKAGRLSRGIASAFPGESESLIWITIATYNERENVGSLIPELRRAIPRAHILVVDDASPDGTGKLVRQMAQDDPRIHLLATAVGKAWLWHGGSRWFSPCSSERRGGGGDSRCRSFP